MKKNILKICKIVFVPATALFILLLIWANWNPATYSEKNVPPVIYIALDLSSDKVMTDKENFKALEKEMNAMNGVTACSVNGTSLLAGIMFNTSVISKQTIHDKVSGILGHRVTEKEFEPASNGCPVGGITSFILAIKQTLRFRA